MRLLNARSVSALLIACLPGFPASEDCTGIRTRPEGGASLLQISAAKGSAGRHKIKKNSSQKNSSRDIIFSVSGALSEGMSVNGDFFHGNASVNDRISYENDAGAIIHWEAGSDWGVQNLGTPGPKWVAIESGHRYYNEADAVNPPSKGWKAREGYASGTMVLTYKDTFHDKAAHFPQNLSGDQSVLNCSSGAVWIIVSDDHEINWELGKSQRKKNNDPIPEHIPPNIPDGICLEYVLASSSGCTTARGEWPCVFWERRYLTMLQYLEHHPAVTFVIMTDADIYVNPLTKDDVMGRFYQLATDEARVVVGVDQTCWKGYPCKVDEANEWLKVVRESGTGQENIRVFAHSQFMGEAEAVKAMLRRALVVSPDDDQRAMVLMAAESPRKFAIDVNETLFLSLSRGFVPCDKTDSWMICNFGGNYTTTCDLNRTIPWGSCHFEDGFIDIEGGNNWQVGTRMRALSLHLNGPGAANMRFGKGCQEIYDSVPSWH